MTNTWKKIFKGRSMRSEFSALSFAVRIGSPEAAAIYGRQLASVAFYFNPSLRTAE